MEETHILHTSQIMKFIEKLEKLLMYYRETGNRDDNDDFYENLNILEDEFAHFIYPLIIPDPICTFSYLCNVLLNFNSFGLKKSSLVFLNAKLPATPTFLENKKDIRLVFKNCHISKWVKFRKLFKKSYQRLYFIRKLSKFFLKKISIFKTYFKNSFIQYKKRIS